jgi:predicted DNA-binding transcriptional regulator YafY
VESRVTSIDDLATLLPADDPDPGVEVDVSPAGVIVRWTDAPRPIRLADDELAALRHGLSLIRGPEAAALRNRLPDAPAEVSDDAPLPGEAELVLRLAPAPGAWLLARAIGDVDSQRDGSVLWRVRTAGEADMLAWLLRLGPRVEIVSPRPRRTALIEQVIVLAEQLRSEPPTIPPVLPES